MSALETPDLPGLAVCLAFPGGSAGKESGYNAGDLGLVPGSGRSPGEMNGHPLLAWRIPWTEEPGGLQSMGLQRDRQDCATNTFTFTFIGNIFNRERLNAFLMLVNKAVISNPHHFFLS